MTSSFKEKETLNDNVICRHVLLWSLCAKSAVLKGEILASARDKFALMCTLVDILLNPLGTYKVCRKVCHFSCLMPLKSK